jgi:superfamily II DNA or RNA helicase
MALLAKTGSPSLRSPLKPWTLTLRQWQAEACRSWAERLPENDLWIATPGAGKTLATSRLAHALLDDGVIDQIIYVVPRDPLKEQTARSFAPSGIHLDYRFANSDAHVSRDVHGIVVTYQQVVASASLYAKLAASRSTLVVLDEVHHAGDGATWGEQIRIAFTPARYRLLLSGTPFRTDGKPLPFVTYRNDECVAEVVYGYADALVDNVCRQLVFALFDGEATWVGRDGEKHTSTFGNYLKKSLHSERLRTHLLADSFDAIITEAHEALMRVRNHGHPDAGGLIVCMSIDHATDIAERVQRITGTTPVLVVSEDGAEGRQAIKTFKRGRTPWIVAVNMISEGVDIPRLRVGVYATNIRSFMYFMQFCGRFVRMQRGIQGPQRSYIYIAAEPTLVTYAHRIKDEVVGAMRRRALKLREAQVLAEKLPPGPNHYKIVNSSMAHTGTLHGELPPPPAARLEPHDIEPPDADAEDDDDVVLIDAKESLKKTVLGLVARCAREFNVEYPKIHATLKRRCGGVLKTATLEQLTDRKRVLQKWLADKSYDGYK